MSMTNGIVETLIDRYGLVSDQVERRELATVLTELERALERPGAVVEFGCYIGTTSLYIRRLLDARHADRAFHVYDSFEGLPEKTAPDMSPAGEQFVAGELLATKKQFIREFQKAGLRTPVIHKAWFDALTLGDVPDNVIFAFLDGDYYESVKRPLELLTPKLAPGAIIVVDDYASEALPGAALATDEWCRLHGYAVRTAHSLAIVRT